MELQRLSLATLNLNKTLSQTKPARKPSALISSSAGKASSMAEEDQMSQSSQKEVLISVSSAVADSNGIDLSSRHLSFSVDEGTGDTVINIVDNGTGEVVRQIPPDDILKLKKKMVEIQGLLLDRKV